MWKIRFGSLLALLIFCSHANACLNDRSLPQRESEFRSQYESNYTTQVDTSREPTLSEGPMLPVLGATMFFGAIGLAWFGARENG